MVFQWTLTKIKKIPEGVTYMKSSITGVMCINPILEEKNLINFGRNFSFFFTDSEWYPTLKHCNTQRDSATNHKQF